MASLKSLVDMGLTEIPEAYIRPEDDRPTVTPIYTDSIPVIDLQALHGPSRAHVVNAITRACEEWGFFQLKFQPFYIIQVTNFIVINSVSVQVINHGVPESVLTKMVEAHHGFFQLQEEEKSKYRSEDNGNPVLYGTSFSAKNEKVLQWRDYLGIIVPEINDSQTLEMWPQIIRDAAEEYLNHTKMLATNLLSALSESLGTSCELAHVMGYRRLLLNYYPPCPNPEMAFGVGRHSDPGLLTLLLQDDVGGLQVLHNEKWIVVQPIPNALVINVGDSLQVLSNGRFQSVEHRAVPSLNQTRLSIPMFCDPDFSTVVKPIAELINDESPAKYRSFTYGEYVAYFLNKPLQGKADTLAYARIS